MEQVVVNGSLNSQAPSDSVQIRATVKENHQVKVQQIVEITM